MLKKAGGNNVMVFLLAFFGMICWGIAPIFAKMGLKSVNPLAGLTIRTMFASAVIVSTVMVSGGLSQIKNISFNNLLLIGIEAILATLVGDLAYYAAIKKGDVSMVTIIMSSSPLVTILCAVIFLGEQITLIRVIGAGLVMIGIVLIM